MLISQIPDIIVSRGPILSPGDHKECKEELEKLKQEHQDLHTELAKTRETLRKTQDILNNNFDEWLIELRKSMPPPEVLKKRMEEILRKYGIHDKDSGSEEIEKLKKEIASLTGKLELAMQTSTIEFNYLKDWDGSRKGADEKIAFFKNEINLLQGKEPTKEIEDKISDAYSHIGAYTAVLLNTQEYINEQNQIREKWNLDHKDELIEAYNQMKAIIPDKGYIPKLVKGSVGVPIKPEEEKKLILKAKEGRKLNLNPDEQTTSIASETVDKITYSINYMRENREINKLPEYYFENNLPSAQKDDYLKDVFKRIDNPSIRNNLKYIVTDIPDFARPSYIKGDGFTQFDIREKRAMYWAVHALTDQQLGGQKSAMKWRSDLYDSIIESTKDKKPPQLNIVYRAFKKQPKKIEPVVEVPLVKMTRFGFPNEITYEDALKLETAPMTEIPENIYKDIGLVTNELHERANES